MLCPKCGYEQSENDGESQTECEKCGVIFAKIVLNCPRCNHIARGTEIKVPNHCPECGVDVIWFRSDHNAKSARSNDKQKSPTPSVSNIENNSPTTLCPACSGAVAYGAKQCPHCGLSKPAPKPKKALSKWTLAIAALAAVAMAGVMNQGAGPSGSGGLSPEFKEQAATLINLNGFLCAEVESAFKPREDQFEVRCKLYRQGSSDRETYIVNTVSGKVAIKQ